MDPTCCDSVAPPALTVQVCFPGVRAAVLDNLNRQREEGRLCDLSIQVQGQVFRAHRCVLAASSPYFHDQVLLKNVTTVSLPSVMDPVAFESVLSSAYTGQLSIIHDDIVNYVTVASFLQMWHIVDKCTEILKRPRPPGEAASAEGGGARPGSASRQQSPSSTECLYVEREGRRRERKPDALPPLATWRRPQQAARWSRPRPSSEQHSADSQVDGLPGYVDGDPSGCQEQWSSGPGRTDGPGQTSRYLGGAPALEALKQRVRFLQRGAPQSRDGEEAQDRRRNARRETEADEGVGEEEEETKDGFAQMDLRVPDDGEDAGRAAGSQSLEVMKDKARRDDASSHVPDVPDGGADAGAPGPSCPDSGRVQFQSGSWSQQEQSRPEGEDEDEDEDVDFECFASYSRDAYNETEEGMGPVSQRPLLSPDFPAGASDIGWPSTSGGHGGALAPSSSSTSFPPPPSPPTPSSSSSVSISGAAYAGKVHFCHCGKAYTLKSMRDRHVKMQHLNLRPFGCPVCTKSFKMKHHLTKHLKTHGGLRPYECSLCGKKVIWRDSFLRHQARCERLASSGGSSATAAATDQEDRYGFGFDDGEAFVPAGQVKVEEAELQRDMDDGMGGLLGMELGAQPHNLDSVGHVFKKEAAERFGDT